MVGEILSREEEEERMLIKNFCAGLKFYIYIFTHTILPASFVMKTQMWATTKDDQNKYGKLGQGNIQDPNSLLSREGNPNKKVRPFS